MITYLKGDATNPQAKGQKIIAHIVNDKGGWGKGFVLSISKRWKKPETAYREWYNSRVRDDFKLGNVDYVQVRNDILIANMLAQQGYNTDNKGPPIRYDALKKCLADVYEVAEYTSASVHMPRIGTGLSGGKWEIIGPMIEEIFADSVKVYVYDY